jgi:hypothetical protein
MLHGRVTLHCSCSALVRGFDWTLLSRPNLSAVSVTAGTILPYLAARDSRLLRQRLDGDVDDDEVDEDEELSRIRTMVRSWKAEAARMGKPLRLPAMPFMLRNIWTIGLLLFGILMTCTVFVRTVWQVRSNTIAAALDTER